MKTYDAVKTYGSGVRSVAAIAEHPLHPVFIVFPAAFLTALLASDIVFAVTRNPFWAGVSAWLAMAGVVMGGVAGLAGIIEFLFIRRVRELSAGWVHGISNVIVLLLAIVNVWLRWGDPVGKALPSGIVLSAITFIILVISAWLGGELAYRYGIGVLMHPAGRGEAAERLSSAA